MRREKPTEFDDRTASNQKVTYSRFEMKCGPMRAHFKFKVVFVQRPHTQHNLSWKRSAKC